MADFHAVAIKLQTTIAETERLVLSSKDDTVDFPYILGNLQALEDRLYSDDVIKPGILTLNEIADLYSSILKEIDIVTVDISHYFNVVAIPRELIVCCLEDPEVKDIDKDDIFQIIIYRLQLIVDVVRLLIRDNVLPRHSSLINGFIYKNYSSTIELLSEFVSWEGKSKAKNISKLWEVGYATTARDNSHYLPYVELILKDLTTITIPIKGPQRTRK